VSDDWQVVEEALSWYTESSDKQTDALAALARLREREAQYRNALEIIASQTYPAVYIGKREDGTEMYGGSDDASRFARRALAHKEETP